MYYGFVLHSQIYVFFQVLDFHYSKQFGLYCINNLGNEDGAARRHRPLNCAAAQVVTDHGTNNFATIRTTSIVTKQQKEHMQVGHLTFFLFNI